MGLSWNLLSGYSGLVSFGHAAFFGLGAYTVTLALVLFDITPWFGIPLGMVVGAVAGAIIGYPTFRLRGHYFALAMLAYPLALLYVFEWLGYQEVRAADEARGAGLVHAVHAITASMSRSRSGWWWRHCWCRWRSSARASACRCSRSSRTSLRPRRPGIDTLRWKMRAIILSGALAAAAGGLYAVVLLVVTPDSVFGVLTSAQALIVALFGGVATLWGPVIGAAILVPLSESLQAQLGNIVPGIQGVVYGIAIVLVILLAPEGIYWRVRDRLVRHRASAAAHRPRCASATPLPVALRAAAMPTASPILDGGGAVQIVWRAARGRGGQLRGRRAAASSASSARTAPARPLCSTC